VEAAMDAANCLTYEISLRCWSKSQKINVEG